MASGKSPQSAQGDESQIDRKWFWTYSHDFSLLRFGSVSKLSEGRDWPPPTWHTDCWPDSDSDEAIKQWFDALIHPRGILVTMAVGDNLREGNADSFVADAWELARHLKQLGRAFVPEGEQEGPYTPASARATITRLREQLFGLPNCEGELATSKRPQSNADDGAKAALSIAMPDWFMRFRSKQHSLLKALWGKDAVSESDLFKTLAYTEVRTQSENLKRRVTETNKSLAERITEIGECWTIRERTRDGIKSYFLERQK